MESLNPFLTRLTPLTSLASRVEAFASRCLPDFIYTESNTRDLIFREIELGKVFDTDLLSSEIGFSLDGNTEQHPHLFTRWSRSQLLAHLGTREKWFAHVTHAQQAAELNMRAHTLHNFMIRTMRSFEDENVHVVRGLVSSRFADIPDTDIMKALLEVLPGGYALQTYSGKTDRAFYAYAITADKIGIPGTSFEGFPGVVVKNSEVGYSSLQLIPMLYLPTPGAPLILEKKILLKRVHRGSIPDLVERFHKALDEAKVLWGPLEQKLAKLATVSYGSEDAAVEALNTMLVLAKAQGAFTWRCTQAYRAAKHHAHNGLSVFNAVLDRVKHEDGQDDAYTSAALAGAILLQLIR